MDFETVVGHAVAVIQSTDFEMVAASVVADVVALYVGQLGLRLEYNITCESIDNFHSV